MTDILTRLDEAAARAMFERNRQKFDALRRTHEPETPPWEDQYEGRREGYLENAATARRAILAALDAKGFVVVPKVATEEMLESAGYDEPIRDYRDDFVGKNDRIEEWTRFLAGAPTLKEPDNV